MLGRLLRLTARSEELTETEVAVRDVGEVVEQAMAQALGLVELADVNQADDVVRQLVQTVILVGEDPISVHISVRGRGSGELARGVVARGNPALPRRVGSHQPSRTVESFHGHQADGHQEASRGVWNPTSLATVHEVAATLSTRPREWIKPTVRPSASMGPSLSSDGDSTARPIAACSPTCFNGAVAEQRRRLVAEVVRALCVVLASMGPSLSSDGDLRKRLAAWTRLCGASMGPSLSGNGDRWPSSKKLRAACVGFNGAVAEQRRRQQVRRQVEARGIRASMGPSLSSDGDGAT